MKTIKLLRNESGQHTAEIFMNNRRSTTRLLTGIFGLILWCTSASTPVSAATKAGDFDGDGKADMTVWRASDRMWHVLTSTSNFSNSIPPIEWGIPGDVPMAGDFDGDGKADMAVWRPSINFQAQSGWFVHPSSGLENIFLIWGQVGDVPLAGDFDGDGKADMAVWRPALGQLAGDQPLGGWFVHSSMGLPNVFVQWGVPGDVPLAGDFDGDGKADMTVWRASDGKFHVLTSSSNFDLNKPIVRELGQPGDVALAGDFDGDGKADMTVWRPAVGNWYVLTSSSNFSNSLVRNLGIAGDVPLTGDFDGDGKADMAAWRA